MNELTNRLFDYCREKGLSFQESKARHVDFDVWNGRNKVGVIVKDWNRALGYNVVVQADWAKRDYHFSQVIILTNRYSPHAKSLADKINIPLFRHWDPLEITLNTE